jgi:hypothetical protein
MNQQQYIPLGAGSGLSRLASGTVGTLWAWTSFGILQSFLTASQIGWMSDFVLSFQIIFPWM